MSVLELRSYTIRSGMAVQFARVMRETSLPMLQSAGHDVVAFLPCLDSPSAFVLMRAYRDAAHRRHSQQQFYDSEAWRHGPREDVLACIETYTSVVIDADDILLARLRRPHTPE